MEKKALVFNKWGFHMLEDEEVLMEGGCAPFKMLDSAYKNKMMGWFIGKCVILVAVLWIVFGSENQIPAAFSVVGIGLLLFSIVWPIMDKNRIQNSFEYIVTNYRVGTMVACTNRHFVRLDEIGRLKERISDGETTILINDGCNVKKGQERTAIYHGVLNERTGETLGLVLYNVDRAEEIMTILNANTEEKVA